MAVSRTPIRDVEIEWEEHGAGGRTFALLHGFTGARSDFEAHFAALAGDRRLVALDHRGHGGSTNTGRGEGYTLENLAQDSITWLEAVADAPVDLLGHSMGGMIALQLVLARPDLVRSLILMDTSAQPPRVPVKTEGLADLVRDHGVRKVVEMAARDLPERGITVERKGAEWVERDATRRLSALDPQAFLSLLPQVFGCPDVRSRLPTIRCPVTVLVGGLDEAFVRPSHAMAERLPNARLVEIDGAYHSPQHTHPAEWLAAVRGHLTWVDGS